MFTIRTETVTSANGTEQVKASGHDRQRTIRAAKTKSADQNHGAAVGTLLNLLTDDRQQAMLRHPSGGQRVKSSHNEIAPGVFVTDWYIDA